MALKIHLTKRNLPLPSDELTYVIEPFYGTFYHQRLLKVINVESQADPLPSAFVWDDLVYVLACHGRIRPRRLCWPLLDPWLTRSVSHQGRCAVRADLLHSLHQEGRIENLHNTSQALTYLTAAGAFIQVLSTPMRFTGWEAHSLYQPIVDLQPETTASSISIIINYRDRPDLMFLCLKSIQQQEITAGLQVILIDNQSEPHNREEVNRQIETFLPDPISVQHLKYDAPFNHSAQTNLGVEHATGEVLVMLNNDARFVDSHVLQSLSDWALTPNMATVGPRVIGLKQRLVASGIQVYSSTAKKPTGICESTVRHLSKTVRGTAGNSFSCAAMTRTTWHQLEGLSMHRFATQYNDADYCLRALEQGFQHLYIGSLTVYHEPGQSENRTRTSTDALHNQLRNYFPNLSNYTRLAPELVPIKTSPQSHILNSPFSFRALEKYRRLRNKIDNFI